MSSKKSGTTVDTVEPIRAVAVVIDAAASLFDELSADAAVHGTVEAVLSDADAKKSLVDVPFVVKRAVYRESDKGQFVSLEVVIGPNVGAFPKDSIVVINDGSTGIFRQITSYIEAQGWVTLPDGPSTGKAGETRFDAPYDQWVWSDEGTRNDSIRPRFTDTGEHVIDVDFVRPLLCRRGLRPSVYGATGDTVTTYLA